MDGQEALQALRQSPPTSTTLSDEAQISRPNKSVSSYSLNILMPHILLTSSDAIQAFQKHKKRRGHV